MKYKEIRFVCALFSLSLSVAVYLLKIVRMFYRERALNGFWKLLFFRSLLIFDASNACAAIRIEDLH